MVSNYYSIEEYGYIGNFLLIFSIVSLTSQTLVTTIISNSFASLTYKLKIKILYLNSAIIISAALFFLTAIIFLIFSDKIQNTYYPSFTSNYNFLLIFGSLVTIFSSVFLGVINGLGSPTYYSLSIIIGSLASLIFLLTALIVDNNFLITALVSGQIVTGFFVIFFGYKTLCLKINLRKYFYFPSKGSIYLLKKFLPYILYGFFSVVLIQFTNLYIRSRIDISLDATNLSYWYANLRISEAYMQIPTIILTSIFFPIFTKVNTNNALAVIIKSTYNSLIYFILILLIIYPFKEYLFLALFNTEYVEASKFFLHQLAIDFFKLLTFSFTLYLLAKRNFLMCMSLDVLRFLLLSPVFFVDMGALTDYFNLYLFVYIVMFLILFIGFVWSKRIYS